MTGSEAGLEQLPAPFGRQAGEFVGGGGAVEGFLALPLELLLEARELALGVQGEVAVLNPGEIGGFVLPDIPRGASFVLAEADGRLAVVVQVQAAGEIHGAGTGADLGERVHVIFQHFLLIFSRFLVAVQLRLEHFVSGEGVGFGRMRVLEILAAAVEAVRGPEVARFHVVVDVLDIDHLAFVEVDLADGLEHRRGLVMGLRVRDAGVAILPHALDFLGEERQVELDGVEAGQVAAFEPLRDLRQHIDELGAVHEVLVLHAVHFRGARVDGDDAMVAVVPGLDLPGLDEGLAAFRHHLHETQFDDAVRGNIKAGALDVEEEQRPCKIQFHKLL